MTFKDCVTAVGRVTLTGFPGQLKRYLVRTITERSKLLETRINDLDAEFGFTYPPIEILPHCILAPWKEHVIFARTSCRSFVDEGYIVVQLSAPTLLAFTGEQLDAILAHEFLHYVWDTIDFVSSASPRSDGVLVSCVEEKFPEYMKSPTLYPALDAQQQAMDGNWLPPRLLALFRKLSGPDKEMLIKPSMLDAFEKWLKRGYPVEKTDPNYRYRGPLNLDEAVVERARQLGLITL